MVTSFPSRDSGATESVTRLVGWAPGFVHARKLGLVANLTSSRFHLLRKHEFSAIYFAIDRDLTHK